MVHASQTRHPACARAQACQACRVAARGRWKYSRLPQMPRVQTMVVTPTTIACHEHHLRETESETARTPDALAHQPAHPDPDPPAHQPTLSDTSPPTNPSPTPIAHPQTARLIIVPA